MSYKIIPTSRFKREVKKLNKKHLSIKNDLTKLGKELKTKPNIGTPLGGNIFKVRIVISSKAKGKSAGARIITYLIWEEKEIYLLTIYDKSSIDTISLKALKQLVNEVLEIRE